MFIDAHSANYRFHLIKKWSLSTNCKLGYNIAMIMLDMEWHFALTIREKRGCHKLETT